MDALGKVQADARRLQGAIDAEYRGAAFAAVRPQPGESADWIEIRNALAGKVTVPDALLDESASPAAGVPPPRSVWRKP